MGLSTATIQTITQDGLGKLTDNPRKEVPILVGKRHTYPEGHNSKPEVEPVHKTISYDRYAKIQAGLNASERLKQEIPEINGDNNISVGIQFNSSSKQNVDIDVFVRHIDRKKRMFGTDKIKIERPSISFDKIESLVPSHASGTVGDGQYKREYSNIPVKTEKVTEEEQAFDQSYRPVPGGCKVETSILGYYGTLTYSMYDLDYKRRMLLTSGHVVDGVGGCYQPVYGSSIGNAVNSKCIVEDGFHAGIIDTIDVANQYPGLANGSGGTRNWTLAGTRSWEWIINEGYHTSYNQQGVSSGITTGTTYSVENSSQEKFSTNIETQQGDSGGPYYEYNSGEYWLIGLHNWGAANRPGGIGNGIHQVENRLNLLA